MAQRDAMSALSVRVHPGKKETLLVFETEGISYRKLVLLLTEKLISQIGEGVGRGQSRDQPLQKNATTPRPERRGERMLLPRPQS